MMSWAAETLCFSLALQLVLLYKERFPLPVDLGLSTCRPCALCRKLIREPCGVSAVTLDHLLHLQHRGPGLIRDHLHQSSLMTDSAVNWGPMLLPIPKLVDSTLKCR